VCSSAQKLSSHQKGRCYLAKTSKPVASLISKSPLTTPEMQPSLNKLTKGMNRDSYTTFGGNVILWAHPIKANLLLLVVIYAKKNYFTFSNRYHIAVPYYQTNLLLFFIYAHMQTKVAWSLYTPTSTFTHKFWLALICEFNLFTSQCARFLCKFFYYQ